MKGKVVRFLGVTGCVLAIFSGTLFYAEANAKKEVICEGIHIGSIDVGGMTVKKAAKTLKKYVEEAKGETVTINIDDEQVTTTLEALGYSCDVNAFVEKAYNYGRTGDIIKRYKDRKDVEQKEVVYDLAFELDTNKVEKFVKKECTVFDIQAQNATMKRSQGEFVITESTNGREIVADETAKKIEKVIASQWNTGGIEIDAIMNDTTPQFDSSTLEECKEVVGSYSTSFASSSSARSQNLVNAARLVDGTIVYPGETFSMGDLLVPFTEENGYEVASAYSNGQVVDSVGGGVCQAATTLYNALLKSELEIVERYNHSMIVGYAKPSMDAAISEGYKDLKFKNNTETPIYIEAYTANRNIYFTLYGKETRDLENRRVEYESEIIETLQPGEDKVTIDESLPEGYETVTQSAHVGYKAKLWKIVYENGEQVSKEQVNYSYYAPEPRYITKGGKSSEAEEDKDKKKSDKKENANEEETTETKQENNQQSNTQTKATATPVPVTKAPEATKAPVATKEPVTEATTAPTQEPQVEEPVEENTVVEE